MPGWRGQAFDAGMIDDCVAGLEAIGALAGCVGLLTGYLGKAEIGEAALRALAVLNAANPDAVYCCDPVIGDVDRGSYVAREVADFFRDRALPAATIATPNAFELEWLTGGPVRTLPEARAAVATLMSRGPAIVAVTSLMLDDTPDGRAGRSRRRRNRALARADAKAADRAQRLRRPVRGALLPSQARERLDPDGPFHGGLVDLRSGRRDTCFGPAGACAD